MIKGEPNLSTEERNSGEGVMALFYVDGDYRTKFFNGGILIDYIAEEFDSEVVDDVREEAMLVLEDRAVDTIKRELIPYFKQALINMRAEEGEPEQEGFEAYWRGALIHQDFNEEYKPIPRIDAETEALRQSRPDDVT